MKRVVFFTSLILAFLALPFLIAVTPTAAQVAVDPDEFDFGDVKTEQLKRGSHTIVRDVRPPRINGDRLQDFKKPNLNVREVKPFDRRDLMSPLAMPLPDKEHAAALEFQGKSDQLRGRQVLGEDLGLSADAPLVHIPTPTQEPVRFVLNREDPGMNRPQASGQMLAGADEASQRMAQEAQSEIRFGNRLSNADLNNFQFSNEDAAEQVNQEADIAADKAFEFNHMAGTDQFSGNISGIPSSAQPMSVESGSASLDRNNNLNVSVRGLRNADGASAAGQKFGAGVACMDSGYFRAGGDQDQGFTLDETGSADFNGQLDFAGQSCVAPMPMVIDETGSFVAVGAHFPMNDGMFHADQTIEEARDSDLLDQ
jgi:hypothetical protein